MIIVECPFCGADCCSDGTYDDCHEVYTCDECDETFIDDSYECDDDSVYGEE